MTTNLAQALVRQPDRRVLIIDGDLRCARLHVPLGAPSSPGLSDYLCGEADEMAVIQHGQEGNLCFIPGGKEVTDPSELLSNGRLARRCSSGLRRFSIGSLSIPRRASRWPTPPF